MYGIHHSNITTAAVIYMTVKEDDGQLRSRAPYFLLSMIFTQSGQYHSPCGAPVSPTHS